MTDAGPTLKAGKAHPVAVGVLVVGVIALIAGLIRVSLVGESVPFRPAISGAGEREPGPMRIVATIPPMAWVARGLAPAGSEVVVLAPTGAGCEGIELTPGQAAAVRRADVVVRVGFGLDDGVVAGRGALRAWQREAVFAEVVEPDERIAAGRDAAGHEGHDHATVNPHVWLDPVLVARFVRVAGEAVRDSEAGIRVGEGAASAVPTDIAARVAALEAECRDVGGEFMGRLASAGAREIITQHDAFVYLARRFGLEVAAVIQHSHDVEPSPAEISEVSRIMAERGIKAVFTEPQIDSSAARRIAEVAGARILVLDPLGDGDWPAMMRGNLDALVEGLGAR